MEVRFDNKANILNARLLATHDNSPIYATKTNFTFRGRDITLLQDTNPALSSGSVTVGAIHWKDKIIEVNGYRKKVADLKEKKTGFLNKARSWKWSAERREYEIEYTNDEWTVSILMMISPWTSQPGSLDGKSKVVGRFAVPYRPHLFTKADPPLLSITRTALVEDEIFLLLVFIYSEAKRQDDTVCIHSFCSTLSTLNSIVM
ncbi:hypothetical protein J3R30DRAFT_3291126 [Lentinula aciculospora]|uniref:Uncharacterized protein n=1 Tax=Lentinula aciculospora TaxID=153920 RepID=A0A9W9A8T1_9AGAR|nr:hypothetical protein J3R30DRAFT_3291126 [Lentinula aciculospora]